MKDCRFFYVSFTSRLRPVYVSFTSFLRNRDVGETEKKEKTAEQSSPFCDTASEKATPERYHMRHYVPLPKRRLSVSGFKLRDLGLKRF